MLIWLVGASTSIFLGYMLSCSIMMSVRVWRALDQHSRLEQLSGASVYILCAAFLFFVMTLVLAGLVAQL